MRGFGLRQVIIPRLPFRVPTDPLQEAQHEYEAQQGRDPFRVLSLPSAVIKITASMVDSFARRKTTVLCLS